MHARAFPFHIDKKLTLLLSLLILLVGSLSVSMLSLTEAAYQTSPTPEEFNCNALSLEWATPAFDSNTLQLLITNPTNQPVELGSVYIAWDDIPTPYNNMYLGAMALNRDVHWQGGPSASIKANGTTQVNTGQLTMGNRTIGAQSSNIWSAVFVNGPAELDDYIRTTDFSMFFTLRITDDSECGKPVMGIGYPGPTTVPHCFASILPTVREFTTAGGVAFEVTNNGRQTIDLTGFSLVWPDATHPDIQGEPAEGYGLARVYAGGDTLGAGQLIWQANTPMKPGNTNTSPPFNNRTDSTTTGTWLGNAAIASGSTTRIWLDFDNISGSLWDYQARRWHFEDSSFRFTECADDITVTPTVLATATPTCATVRSISLQFGGFTAAGGVYFNVINDTSRDKFLTGFDLVWPDATHPEITGEPAEGYGLARIYVGGDTLGGGQLIWQANPAVKPGNTNLAPPYNNRTISSAKGTWIKNERLPAGVTTRVWLDFDDISGKLSDFGAASYHFNGSRFKIACVLGEDEMTLTPTSTLVDLPTLAETATPTPTPFVPGVTATATASTALSELLPNTSFETDADNDKVPDGWTTKDSDPASRDKLQCKADSDKVHSSLCAYRLTANPDGDPSVLSFKTSTVELTERVQYEFLAYVSSQQLNADMLIGKAKLTFTDGSAETIRLVAEGPSAGYQLLTEMGQFDRAGRTLKKLTVQFRFPAAKGKLWLDDVSFKVSANTPLILQPLP